MPVSGASAGRLFIELLLKDDQFKAAMQDAAKNVQMTTKGMGVSAIAFGNMISNAFTAAARAIVSFGKQAVKVGIEFEQAMATLGAISMQKQGTEGFQALEEQARLLGRETLYTATQAAEALTALAQAGFSVKQSIEASNAVLLYAGSTNIALADSAAIVASTIKQFGFETDQAGRIADVFSKAIRTSLLDAESLREAMKYAGSAGAAFGNTLEETVAAVAAFRDLGLEGSLAGNAFKMMLVQVSQQTEENTAALAKYGLTFADVNPEQHTAVEILRTMAEVGINATDAFKVFGARAGAYVAAIAQNIRDGKTNLESFTAALEASGGETADMYATILDTVRSQALILKSAIEDLFISVFKLFGGDLKALLVDLQGFVVELSIEVQRAGPEMASGFSELFRIVRDLVTYYGPELIAQMVDLGRVMVPLITSAAELVRYIAKGLELINMVNPGVLLLKKAMGALAPEVQKSDGISRDHVEALGQLRTKLHEASNAAVNLEDKLAAEREELDATRQTMEEMEQAGSSMSAGYGELSVRADELRQSMRVDEEQLASIEQSNVLLAKRIEITRQAGLNEKAKAKEEATREAELARLREEALARLRENLGETTDAMGDAVDKWLQLHRKFLDSAFKLTATEQDQAIAEYEQQLAEIAAAAAEAGQTGSQQQAEAEAAAAEALQVRISEIEAARVEAARRRAEQVADLDASTAEARLEAMSANMTEEEYLYRKLALTELQIRRDLAQALAAIDADTEASQEEAARMRSALQAKAAADVEAAYADTAAQIEALSETVTTEFAKVTAASFTSWSRLRSDLAAVAEAGETAAAQIGAAWAGTMMDIASAGSQAFGFLTSTLTGMTFSISQSLSMARESMGLYQEDLAAYEEERQRILDEIAEKGGAAVAGSETAEEIAALRAELEALEATKPKGPRAAAREQGQALADEAIALAKSLAMAIGPIFEAFIAKIPEMMEAIAAAIGPVIRAIIEHAPDMVIAILEELPTIVTALVESIVRDLIPRLPWIAVQLVWAIVKAVIQSVTAIAEAIWDALWEGLGSFFGEAGKVFAKMASGLVDGLREAGQWLIDGMKSVAQKIAEAFKGATEKVGGWFKEAFTKGKDQKILGLFQTGAPFIPEPGWAFVHPGEAIIPAHENPFNPGVDAGVPWPMSASEEARRTMRGGIERVDLNVLIDGRAVDGAILRSSRRGQMPGLQQMLRKGRGTRMGLDRRKFQSRVS